MSSNPAHTNNRRYDLSNRLIHFFRDLDLSSSDAPATPEHWGHSSIPEDVDMPAFFLLRHCIRQGRMWATWSYRGNARTIYGPRAAVCFTDMPIPAFIETSRTRWERGQAIAPYALVLPKPAMFDAGARPVIYGLSTDANPSIDRSSGDRLLPSSALPLMEQYRYVAYDPSSGRLDWAHEREWRWPCDEPPWFDPDGIPPGESGDIPGLGIDDPSLGGIGVIVRTDDEAERVVYDILTKVDRGDIPENHYQFVLVGDLVRDWTRLREADDMDEAIHDSIIDLSPYFGGRRMRARAVEEEIDELAEQIEASTGPSNDFPEVGGCWLWLRDNRHPIVRALARVGRTQVTHDGHYLVDLPSIDRHRPLRQRQEMIERISSELERRHDLAAGYFAVLNSRDPDAIPTYHNDSLDDDFFWNFSHDPGS